MVALDFPACDVKQRYNSYVSANAVACIVNNVRNIPLVLEAAKLVRKRDQNYVKNSVMEKLSELERKKLIFQHRKERDKRVCDRIKAVLAYADGYSYSEIARLLLLDDESIRRHIKDYWDDKKLSPENGGSESRLTCDEARELIEHLSQKTYLYVKEICRYVKTKYQKYYSVSGMMKASKQEFSL